MFGERKSLGVRGVGSFRVGRGWPVRGPATALMSPAGLLGCCRVFPDEGKKVPGSWVGVWYAPPFARLRRVRRAATAGWPGVPALRCSG
jgi:hypothetical protein